MSYKLEVDARYWVRTSYNHELMPDSREISDMVEGGDNYYWIVSSDRDDVLVVPDFSRGEQLIQKLTKDQSYTFERAESKFEYVEVSGERPPQ